LIEIRRPAGRSGSHWHNFVGRPNIQRAQAEFNRFHHAGDANAEFRTAKFCPRLLELLDFISKKEPTRAENAFECRNSAAATSSARPSIVRQHHVLEFQ